MFKRIINWFYSKGMSIDWNQNFVMSIAAPKERGKTYLCVKLIQKIHHLFDHVIVISPSGWLSESYDPIRDIDNVNIVDKATPGTVRDVIEKQEQCKRDVFKRNWNEKRKRKRPIDPSERGELGKKRMLEKRTTEPITFNDTTKPHFTDIDTENEASKNIRCPRTLLFIDDGIDAGLIRLHGPLDTIGERGRHMNMSVILVAQRVSAISRSLRLLTDYFLIFSPNQITETEQIMEQFVTREDRKLFRKRVRQAFEIPYTFVMINTRPHKWQERFFIGDADKLVGNKTLTPLF